MVVLTIGFVNNPTNMKASMIILLLISSKFCHAQTFNCGVMSVQGFTSKIESKILITDSIVSVMVQGKETVYKRIPSTSTIYYTDGVVTNSIVEIPMQGRIKGFAYNRTLNMKTNINSGKPGEIVQFCWINP
jgi:hypothetical protein